MAARKRRTTVNEKWREKIQSSMLVDRLLKHAVGQVEMSATQIKAAEILLRKVAPDLKAVEHSGEDGGPLEVVVHVKPHATTSGD
jgi:hypothetical protein